MRKSYRFRIYPTAAQQDLFRRTIGSCRFVYNLCLYQRRLEYHRTRPRKFTSFDQIKELTDLKVEADWLRLVAARQSGWELRDNQDGRLCRDRGVGRA